MVAIDVPFERPTSVLVVGGKRSGRTSFIRGLCEAGASLDDSGAGFLFRVDGRTYRFEVGRLGDPGSPAPDAVLLVLRGTEYPEAAVAPFVAGLSAAIAHGTPVTTCVHLPDGGVPGISSGRVMGRVHGVLNKVLPNRGGKVLALYRSEASARKTALAVAAACVGAEAGADAAREALTARPRVEREAWEAAVCVGAEAGADAAREALTARPRVEREAWEAAVAG